MFRILLPLALLSGLAASPAQAAERAFTVTNYDRVRVDGPYRVRLTTGVAPFARARGSAAGLDSVAVSVQGRTLVVRPGQSGWGGYPGEPAGPVEIEIGTHDLSAAWLNGSGSLLVDEIRGLSFDLSVQGSGSAEIERAEIDQLKVGISGAGTVRLGGSAGKITALVRGTSQLDGGAMRAKSAKIGAEGPSVVRLAVSQEAEVEASGIASVELAGQPACTVRARGAAQVSGCRSGWGR